ncbi:MAG TPA: sulfotransferase domain-containing protein [Woeseiaceae bacterium]|nr:sulfotransferase domain-containing protein [Woeseiaceae bacterium]
MTSTTDLSPQALAGAPRKGSFDARWPDFLVIGVPRSGTTTLHAVLDSAPSICMSAVKEPRYFHSSDDFALFSRRVSDTEEYLKLWAGCAPSQLKGEASPTYFLDPCCPAAVRAAVPLAHLVVILRNPVDRAISHFHYREKRTGKSDLTLDAAIDAAESSRPGDYERRYLLQPGFYGRHLRRWLDYFDAAQIKILLLERLAGDFKKEMEGLFEFLGLPVEEVAALEPMKRNAASLPRSRAAARLMQAGLARRLVRFLHAEQLAMSLGGRLLTKKSNYTGASTADRARLFSIYRDDILDFEALTGIDTGWLRRD